MGRLLAKLGKSRQRTWRRAPRQHTSGTVISSTVQVPAQLPLVIYSYSVDGTVFRGQRVRAADEPCDSATATVARYPAGASVVVYYDPSNPSDALLEP
ncbi:MAG: DUF3592 domain-containing protein [Ilumatobacteraceae bacterium]